MTLISGLNQNVITELTKSPNKVNLNNLVKEIAKDGIVDDNEAMLLEELSKGEKVEIQDKNETKTVSSSKFDPSEQILKASIKAAGSDMQTRDKAFQQANSVHEIKILLEADQHLAGNENSIYKIDNKNTRATAGKILIQDAIALGKAGFLTQEDKEFLHKMISESRSINSFTPEDLKKLDGIIDIAITNLNSGKITDIKQDVLSSSSAAIHDAMLSVKETGAETNKKVTNKVEYGRTFSRMENAIAKLDEQYKLVDNERIKVQDKISELKSQIDKKASLNPDDPDLTSLNSQLEELNTKYNTLNTRLTELIKTKTEACKQETSIKTVSNSLNERCSLVQSVNTNLLKEADGSITSIDSKINDIKKLIDKYDKGTIGLMEPNIKNEIVNLLKTELELLTEIKKLNENIDSDTRTNILETINKAKTKFDSGIEKLQAFVPSKLNAVEFKTLSALQANTATFAVEHTNANLGESKYVKSSISVSNVDGSFVQTRKITDGDFKKWDNTFNSELRNIYSSIKEGSALYGSPIHKLYTCLNMIAEFEKGDFTKDEKNLLGSNIALLKEKAEQLIKDDPYLLNMLNDDIAKAKATATETVFGKDGPKQFANYLLSKDFNPADDLTAKKELQKLSAIDTSLGKEVGLKMMVKGASENFSTFMESLSANERKKAQEGMTASLVEYFKGSTEISTAEIELFVNKISKANNIDNIENLAKKINLNPIEQKMFKLMKTSKVFESIAVGGAVFGALDKAGKFLNNPDDTKALLEFLGGGFSVGSGAETISKMFNIATDSPKLVKTIGGVCGVAAGALTAIVDTWNAVEELEKGDNVGAACKFITAGVGVGSAILYFTAGSAGGPIGIGLAIVALSATIVYETCSESDKMSEIRKDLELTGLTKHQDLTRYRAEKGANINAMSTSQKTELINYYMDQSTSANEEKVIYNILKDTYNTDEKQFLDLIDKLYLPNLANEMEDDKMVGDIASWIIKANHSTGKPPINDKVIQFSLSMLNAEKRTAFIDQIEETFTEESYITAEDVAKLRTAIFEEQQETSTITIEDDDGTEFYYQNKDKLNKIETVKPDATNYVPPDNFQQQPIKQTNPSTTGNYEKTQSYIKQGH